MSAVGATASSDSATSAPPERTTSLNPTMPTVPSGASSNSWTACSRVTSLTRSTRVVTQRAVRDWALKISFTIGSVRHPTSSTRKSNATRSPELRGGNWKRMSRAGSDRSMSDQRIEALRWNSSRYGTSRARAR